MEPIIHHLKNYGVMTWYDRHAMVLGDNRQEKNLDEGATKCKYAIAILSAHTTNSVCAMEELSIIKARYYKNEITVFPILYELSPNGIPEELLWIKELIFKEVDRHSGTREICNHVACKITCDLVIGYNYQSIQDIINNNPYDMPPAADMLLRSYQGVDFANLNSRVALLYAVYLIIVSSKLMPHNSVTNMATRIFERLFSETRLNLAVDYRELWLLENTICILVDYYIVSCTESKI